MAVGEQHGGRVQPVLGEQRVEPVQHPDAGVDHDALLPGAGGDHVAVGAEGVRGKAGDEHVLLPSGPVVLAEPTGRAHRPPMRAGTGGGTARTGTVLEIG